MNQEMTKFKNPQMKTENESNNFLEGDPDVDVILEAKMKRESLGIDEIIPDLSDISWHTVRRRSG